MHMGPSEASNNILYSKCTIHCRFPFSRIMQFFSLPLYSSLLLSVCLAILYSSLHSLYSSLSVFLSVLPLLSLLSPLLLLSVFLATLHSTPLCLSCHSSLYSTHSTLSLSVCLSLSPSTPLSPSTFLSTQSTPLDPSLCPLHSSHHTSPLLPSLSQSITVVALITMENANNFVSLFLM